MITNRNEIEKALDAGHLWAAMRNGNYWQLRRNGKTRTWKRDPARFYLPVKCGLRSTYAITETDSVGPDSFLISETKPSA